jgi:cytochrome c oxidase subunit 1
MATTLGHGAGAQAGPPTWLAWLTTTDHKKIGLMYILGGIFFFLIGGIDAALIRTQLAASNMKLLHPDLYNEIFTMHGLIMIFLFATPTIAGFGNYLVPLMIGQRDMAFPRLNALSLWAFLLGGLLLLVGQATGNAPNAGWFNYVPLSGPRFSRGLNVDFWIVGTTLLTISSTAGAINFIVTILRMRAPGMGINQMPLFVWTVLVTAFIIVVAFPPLSVSAALLYLDRNLGTSWYDPAGGGDPILWQHLFWNFGHPEVYILILPVMGMLSEIFPVFSRKPIFGYLFVAWSTVAIGVLSYTVWAHHMFTVGMPLLSQAFFAANTNLVAVPTAVKIFNWLATMWGGKLRLATPMLFAIGFLGMFLLGGIAGVVVATVPVDWQVHDSYFVVAHFHYVFFGGTAFGLFAGLYYWFPKMSGRLFDERLGRWHFWLWFVGGNLTFMPMYFLGLLGMPRRYYTYDAARGWDFWNLVATVGAYMLAAGTLVALYNLWHAWRRGPEAGPNPWDAWTLEWATSSPPPDYNFARLPSVKSARPLWDEAYPEQADWKQGYHDERL